MRLLSRRCLCAALILAALLSLALTLGVELRACGGLGFSWLRRLAHFLPAWAVGTAVFYALQRLFAVPGALKKPARVPRFWRLFALLFAAYTPALLAYCPGIVAYDATAQILQGIDGAYTAYHPLLHTLLLSGCVRLGGAIHSYTLGAGLYSLVQMTAVAALFTLSVRELARLGVSGRALALTVAFYALYPVNAILAISTTKDTIFAALVALLLVRTIAVLRAPEAFVHSRRAVVSYVLLTIFTALWRNNGMIAVAFMGCFAVGLHKGLRRRLAAIFLAIVIGFFGVEAALIAAFDAETSRSIDAFSLPLQQMARVARNRAEELDGALAAAITEYMPLGAENVYDPHLADPVKMRIDKTAFTRDPATFVSRWLQLGAAYPQEYLDAALLLNQGWWDPLDTSVGRIYHMWPAGQHGYLQTKFQRHLDDSRGLWIEQKSLLPGLYHLYERLCTDNVHQQNPLTNLLFAPASALWLCLMALSVFLVQRRRAETVAASFLLGFFLTHLLGPCALVRYVYPCFTCAPLLLSLLPNRKTA